MLTVQTALQTLFSGMHFTLPRDAADIAARSDITEHEATTLLLILTRAGLASRRERGYVIHRAQHIAVGNLRPGDIYFAASTAWKVVGASVDGAHASLTIESPRRTTTINVPSWTHYMIFRAV